MYKMSYSLVGLSQQGMLRKKEPNIDHVCNQKEKEMGTSAIASYVSSGEFVSRRIMIKKGKIMRRLGRKERK